MKFRTKKLFTGILAAAVLLTFTGCTGMGGNNAKSEIKIDFTEYPSVKALCENTDLAVKATFIGQELNKPIDYSATDEPSYLPATLYTFQVKEVLKGEYTSDTVAVPILGGTLDGTTYTSNTDPIFFEKGKDYLLLLMTFEGKYPAFVNDSQSWYSYEHGEAGSAMEVFPMDEVLEALKEE